MKWTAEMVEEYESKYGEAFLRSSTPPSVGEIVANLNKPRLNEAQRFVSDLQIWKGHKGTYWCYRADLNKALSTLHIVPEKATDEMVGAYCGELGCFLTHKIKRRIQRVLDYLRGVK